MWTYIITRREKGRRKITTISRREILRKKKKAQMQDERMKKEKKLQGQFWFKKIHLMCIDTAEKLQVNNNDLLVTSKVIGTMQSF